MTNFDLMRSVEENFEKYCKKVNLVPFEEVGLGYDNTMSSWDRAWCQPLSQKRDPEESFVEINLKLMMSHPEEVEETVAHEVAHIASPGGHDTVWRNLIQSFGFCGNTKKASNPSAKPIWARS